MVTRTRPSAPLPNPPADRVRPFLANTTFLGRLPAAAIDALVGKGRLKSFARGAVIYRRGDPGDSLMVVIKGRVKIANTSSHGKEIVHYYGGAGEFFGEISALALQHHEIASSAWARDAAPQFPGAMRGWSFPRLRAKPLRHF